jgi:hypothetical protein
MVLVQLTLQGEPATLLWMPHVQQLVCDKHWYGDSPLCILVCALPHQLSVHSSIFCSLLLKGKQYLSPWSTDQWCGTRGFKVYTEDNSLLQPYSCCTIALLRITCISTSSQNVNLPILSTDLQSSYDIERIAFDCTSSSLEINAWCHMMYIVNSLSLSIWQLYVLLLNGEDGSDKRQVVIHIILNFNFLQKSP